MRIRRPKRKRVENVVSDEEIEIGTAREVLAAVTGRRTPESDGDGGDIPFRRNGDPHPLRF